MLAGKQYYHNLHIDVIGEGTHCEDLIQLKVNGWVQSINALAKATRKSPQVVFTAMVKSLQFEWSHVQKVWMASTPKLECRWEQVIGIFKKMGFAKLASDLADAMETSSSRDDQSNGAIGLGTGAVSENRTSSEPSEASCRSEYYIKLNWYLPTIK